MNIKLFIYRYNSDVDNKPYMQECILPIQEKHDLMLLDVLIKLKELDPTLTFRRSCREGVCGSDGMNINGKNGLACITPISILCKNSRTITIRPLPGLPVVRDLVVDMNQFYKQYEKIKPFLIRHNDSCQSLKEYYQSPDDRDKLDGLYECILCACCSTACPSFWWHPTRFIGPAGLLTSYRFLVDSRDTDQQTRLSNLNDSFSVFRCHNIMNCVSVCPKKLNPTKAINHIKRMLLIKHIS
ncbi:succinate dehydrogenase iron-sulfur subunit [Blochmannia endosymbiont of Camponotus (Colobopsis) obliquus]|uniref:succinate dehydrogenase iron-sulfur subunit n=1 Tax=Blochmannia endosymbiont of Camponotus (Colobopsis) obliquus TaxID=1505597 RepID=UPI00061A6B37|nr:succinate dehydrogenase iron-sulfur subunit [Blochmannia endosymbiont of Camponotus (Colobopsis) obliquus]AKC60494.1 succinate dehydrogenase iron-sulfur subunit [Blochmannia endosymbiont of Camponotus (Colobopsis) obliquus]